MPHDREWTVQPVAEAALTRWLAGALAANSVAAAFAQVQPHASSGAKPMSHGG